MTKKSTIVRMHASRAARARKAKESKPHTTEKSRLNPKGHLMAEVAEALFGQFDYGDLVSYEAFEKLLVEHGHPVPEGLANGKNHRDWLHQRRYF